MNLFRINTISLRCFVAFCLISTIHSLAEAETKEGKFFGVKQTEYPSWFKDSFLDFNEDIEEAKSSGKRIMILFYQNGCPYCNALVERNLSQKDIQSKIKKNLDVIAVNMWGDREITYVDKQRYIEKTLAEKLKIQFTPTLLFYDDKGTVILRLNGYRSPQRFSVDLDYIIQRKENEISYRDFIHTNYKAGKTNSKLFYQDFFKKPPYNLTFTSATTKPLAVFFEQKDCPNCVTLHSKILPDKSTRDILKKFDVVQLDMWSKDPIILPNGKSKTVRAWATELDVKFAPTIVVFDTNGTEIIRSEAFFKLFHTQGILAYVLEGAYRKQPSFQRYLTERAEQLREQGNDVDIWNYADQKPGS